MKKGFLLSKPSPPPRRSPRSSASHASPANASLKAGNSFDSSDNDKGRGGRRRPRPSFPGRRVRVNDKKSSAEPSCHPRKKTIKFACDVSGDAASSDARAEQKNDIFLKQLKAFHDDFEKLIDERQKEMEAWRKSEDADEEFHEFSDHGIDPDEVERINQMEPDISLAYETLHPSLKKLLQGAPSSDFASKKLDWEVRMAEMKAKVESSATLLREAQDFSSVKERRRTYTRKMSSQRRPSARKASSLERLEDFVDAARNADLTAQDAITSLQCFHFRY